MTPPNIFLVLLGGVILTLIDQHQEDVDDEVEDREIDNEILHPAAVDTHRENRKRLKEDLLDGSHPELADQDVVDDLDAAGRGPGAGTDEAD